MMGYQRNYQHKFFVTDFNLEDRIRKDHILRKISRKIDLDFVYRIHLLTANIVHPGRPEDRLRQLELKYRYDALGKFERYRTKFELGLQFRYVLPLDVMATTRRLEKVLDK
jgi:hypothetical protein